MYIFEKLRGISFFSYSVSLYLFGMGKRVWVLFAAFSFFKNRDRKEGEMKSFHWRENILEIDGKQTWWQMYVGELWIHNTILSK